MSPITLRRVGARPLIALGLIAVMSGLATSTSAAIAAPAAHDHASHDHAQAIAGHAVPAGVEPADLAPDRVRDDRAGGCTAQLSQLKLPDLRMALVPNTTRDRIRIVPPPSTPVEGEPPFAPGMQLLRFTTIVMNTGTGPFHVKGVAAPQPDQDGDKYMTTRQKLYTTSSVTSDLAQCHMHATPARAQFRGDGHDHWHVERMQRFQLLSKHGDVLGLGYKTGFCYFDGLKKRPDLPGHPSSARFPSSGCGWSLSNDTISMGLSVGWGDVYPWSIAHQWIDVTGLADGEYRLCVTVDPLGHYLERNRTNNQSYSDITIAGLGTSAPTVTTTARAAAACSA
jgi:hypothetical protein